MCVVVLCWIDHVWSSEECVCCACDPNERLSAPLHMFCLCFCMSEVVSSFRSLRAASQVFCSPYVISLSDFAYYCLRIRACSCYASCPFGMLCLSAISMMFVKILLAVCMLVGMVV